MKNNPGKGEKVINNLTEIVLNNLENESFGVRELVNQAGISQSVLSRKIREATGKTINQFIREIRLQKAFEMLRNENLTVAEVAYRTGFASPAYFNSCFNEHFGYSPGKVKKGEVVAQPEVKPVMSGNAKPGSAGRRIIIYVSAATLFLIFMFYILKITIFNYKHNTIDNQSLKSVNSIAVLPFKNLSDSAANQYFVDGIMEDILTLLSKVGDLRVISRTSVEQFRNSKMSTSDIAEKLNTNYLIEGSVQKSGSIFRLWIQLIDGKNGQHLWAEVYDGKYSADIFKFQSSVAKKVAASLDAVIIPREEERIDAMPTTDLIAHKLAMRGGEMYMKWWDTREAQYLTIAINFYNEALKHDPAYLNAILGKGLAYLEAGKYDSARVCVEEVLKVEPENKDAIGAFGTIYMYTNKTDSAVEYFHKLLELSPNDQWGNLSLGQELIFCQNEVIKGLPFFQKAHDLGGKSNPATNMNIADAFIFIGDYPKALKYLKETLLMAPSWCGMVQSYCNLLFIQGNYKEGINFLDSIGKFTPCLYACDIMRFYYHASQRDFKSAEGYLNKAFNNGLDSFTWEKGYYDVYFNYLLKETGRESEARAALEKSVKHYEADMQKAYGLELARDRLKLAASYAMLGEKEKTLNYLSQLEKFGLFEFPLTLSFPGFDNLRGDTEFKSICKRITDKRAAVREKIREMEERGEIDL
jgi:TolB-like protein/AraC-like DNA-binding protein/Tfp pilus assembly protein PilF